jgi:hypothetical protein
MGTRAILLFTVIGLIILSIILFAMTGYNAVYVLTIVLMLASFGLMFFRLRYGLALLFSSVVLILILNGLKRTFTSSGSILDQSVEMGSIVFPLGYFILAGILLIASYILIKVIRNNPR